jgi:hypothetical protein
LKQKESPRKKEEVKGKEKPREKMYKDEAYVFMQE